MLFRVVLSIGAVVGSLLLGVGAGATIWSPEEARSELRDAEAVPAVERPAASGELSRGPWIAGKPSPDLVEGQTDDGAKGFLRTYDLVNLPPAGKDGRVIVPVYAEDGRTQIGQFTAAVVTEKNVDSSTP